RFQLYYPTTLKVLKGWEDLTNPIVAGDVFVTEHFGNNTGIRRFLLGLDVTAISTDYEPRFSGASSHKIKCSWLQVGHAARTVKIIYPGNAGTVTVNTSITIPGNYTFTHQISDGDPDGMYHFDVTLTSIYDITNTYSFSDSLYVYKTVDSSNNECGILVSGGFYHIMDDGSHFEDTHLTGRPCLYPSATKWYGAGVGAVNIFNSNPIQYTWKSAYGAIFYEDTIGSVGVDDSIVTYQDSIYYKLPQFPSGIASGTNLDLLRCEMTLLDNPGVGGASEIPSDGGTGGYDPGSRLGSQRTVLDTSWGCGILQFYTLTYSDWCSTPCTTCVAPGCPSLYSWNGEEFEFVNNILPQSASDTLVFDDKIDFYPIENYVIVDTFFYKFRITEEEQEVSYLDRLEVFAYDLPYSARNLVFDQKGGLIQLTGDPVMPISAITQSGQDVLPMITARDKDIFESEIPGYVDITYRFTDGVRSGATTTASAAAGGGEIPPEEKGGDGPAKVDANFNLSSSRQAVILAKNLLGEYEEIVKSAPRDRKVSMYSQWSDYIINGQLDLRIKWSHSISINYLPFRWFLRPEVKPFKLELRSAVHSTDGERKIRLDRSFDKHVVLRPGEQIDLTYYAEPPPSGIRRMLMLKAKGKYESIFAPRSTGSGILPKTYSFDQNYPNPFNPSTTFSFGLPEAAHVTLKVYNILGQTVVTLIDNDYEAGEHSHNWNGKLTNGDHIATGVYFAKLTAGEFSSSRKMVVLK
ncbi:MAG: T9SS type A sorting domain-containing protein, partial [Candidatus Marinimicrobia bacterium]|nr:T9SS type A sorting domain-containing protein [Candidatus Neomarinimicrobiota bacterium]